MSAKKNTALRNALADIQAGFYANGFIRCMTANGDEAVTFSLGANPFKAASNGVAELDTPVSGEATFYALEGIASAALIGPGGHGIGGLTVGLEGSGADLKLSTLTPAPGSTVNLIAFELEEAEGVAAGL